MCVKRKMVSPCRKGCFTYEYEFCDRLRTDFRRAWSLYRSFQTTHGNWFLHKHRLTDAFCKGGQGCGVFTKKTCYRPKTGINKCEYCHEVFAVQKGAKLGEKKEVAGFSSSPEPSRAEMDQRRGGRGRTTQQTQLTENGGQQITQERDYSFLILPEPSTDSEQSTGRGSESAESKTPPTEGGSRQTMQRKYISLTLPGYCVCFEQTGNAEDKEYTRGTFWNLDRYKAQKREGKVRVNIS
jgi:hypothetical protein